MSKKTRVVHIYPKSGGISDYARTIDQLYGILGYEVVVVLVDHNTTIANVIEQHSGAEPDLYHLEMGAGDSRVFLLGRKLLKESKRPQLVTVHDPGVGVYNPIDNSMAHSSYAPVRFAGKILRKTANTILGKRLKGNYMSDPRVSSIYLRENLVVSPREYFLPHPTFHSNDQIKRSLTAKPDTVGFLSFWGRGKGLETIAEVWEQHTNWPFKLVVAGSTATTGDSYARGIRTRLERLEPRPELKGFIADDQIDNFLMSLSVLLLPYWDNIPNGTSGMALRAAELGVPIIASRTNALLGQLGEQGATYVIPASAESLSAALNSLVTNWQDIQARALDTRKKIQASSSWPVVARQLQNIVEKVRA